MRNVPILLIVGVFLFAYVLFGFFPAWMFDDAEQAAKFSAGYRFANGLVSALAFIAIAFTVFLQRKQLDGADNRHEQQLQETERRHREHLVEMNKKHAEQLNTLQKTARVQALTFFAEWHYRMMQGAQGDLEGVYQRKCDWYGTRALQILKELGEDFSEEKYRLSDSLPTKQEVAIKQLVAIFEWLKNELEGHENPNESNEVALHALAEAGRQATKWKEKNRDIVDTRPLDKAIGLLKKNRVSFPRGAGETPQHLKQWQEYLEEVAVTVNVLDEAVAEIEEASRAS